MDGGDFAVAGVIPGDGGFTSLTGLMPGVIQQLQVLELQLQEDAAQAIAGQDDGPGLPYPTNLDVGPNIKFVGHK